MLFVASTSIKPSTSGLVLIGDSITASYGGWFTAAQAATSTVHRVGQYAQDGRTAATMLGGIATVTAHTPTPAYAIVEGGGNDIRNDAATFATVTGYLSDIFAALAAANIQPIASTVLPGVPAATGGQTTAYMGTNDWLRTYCPANSIPLIDWLPGMTTDANEVQLDATLCADDYHPNAAGILVMASACEAVLGVL